MRIQRALLAFTFVFAASSAFSAEEYFPGGLDSTGLARVVPDTVHFDTEGQAALGNWEPFASVLSDDVFLLEANTFAVSLDSDVPMQRYALLFQPAAGGDPTRGEVFFADDGSPYSGPVNNYRQNGNPGRIAGDMRPGAVNLIAGGEASLHEFGPFQSDDRWDTGVVRNGRYACVETHRFDAAALAQTSMCKPFDAISGRLTSGDPGTDQISRFGGGVAGLDDGNFVVVVDDRSKLHDPADKTVVAVIVAPDGTIVRESFVVALGELWANVSAHRGGFCVRVLGVLYFHDDAGALRLQVDQADPSPVDPFGSPLTFDRGRGDSTRIASHINSPYVYLAGKVGSDIRVAVWDSRDGAWIAQANVNELTEANGGTDAFDYRDPFDRVGIAVDALDRLVVSYEVTPVGHSVPQTVARVLAFDAETAAFSYLTPSFFPFVNWSDGTGTEGGPIRTIRPAVAMTTQAICIAAKGEINGENDPTLGADTPTETNFYTVFAHPDPQADPTPPVGGFSSFLRGDTNNDAKADLSDAVYLLGHLFLGGPIWVCDEAADTNGDGNHDLSDAVYLLGHLFLGGPAPGAPFPECGVDPESDPCPESKCNP